MNDYYSRCCLLLPGPDFLPEQPYNPDLILQYMEVASALPLGARWLISNRSNMQFKGWDTLPCPPADDPGKAMEMLFDVAFKKGFWKVIMLRPVVKGLQTRHLESAFKSLKIIEFCIGPADNGSTWLLGMHQYEPFVANDPGLWMGAPAKETIRKIGELKLALYKCTCLEIA